MDNKDLVRRLALIKANPKLAETIPQGEVLKMLSDVVASFNVLKSAIEANKLRGEKGEPGKDGTTPVAGRDYATVSQVESAFAQSLLKFQADHDSLLAKTDARLKELRDGKDAEISTEQLDQVAKLVYEMVSLPDFDALVTEAITINSEAVRNALELLSGDNRYKVEIADVQGLTEALTQLAQLRSSQGGGIGRNQVYDFIRQAVADGTIPAGGDSGGSVTKGIAEVDFGAVTQNNDIATVSVADTSITATSYPSVTLYAVATTDHDSDDYMAEELSAYVSSVSAGVGFDISVRAPSLTWGKYKVTYMY